MLHIFNRFLLFSLHFHRFSLLLLMLSAHVKRFSVSRMRDFILYVSYCYKDGYGEKYIDNIGDFHKYVTLIQGGVNDCQMLPYPPTTLHHFVRLINIFLPRHPHSQIVKNTFKFVGYLPALSNYTKPHQRFSVLGWSLYPYLSDFMMDCPVIPPFLETIFILNKKLK